MSSQDFLYCACVLSIVAQCAAIRSALNSGGTGPSPQAPTASSVFPICVKSWPGGFSASASATVAASTTGGGATATAASIDAGAGTVDGVVFGVVGSGSELLESLPCPHAANTTAAAHRTS